MKREEIENLEVYIPEVIKSFQTRKKIDETNYGGWNVTLFFGKAPKVSGSPIDSVEFVGIAKTEDLSAASKPTLSKSLGALRVDFDNSSVIIWNSDTRSMITRMLKAAFNGFNWENQHGRSESKKTPGEPGRGN